MFAVGRLMSHAFTLYSTVCTQEMRLRFVIRGEKTANSDWAQGKEGGSYECFQETVPP